MTHQISWDTPLKVDQVGAHLKYTMMTETKMFLLLSSVMTCGSIWLSLVWQYSISQFTVTLNLRWVATHNKCLLRLVKHVLQLKEADPMFLYGSSMATISKADTKFLLIPFFFLLLRIWTMILVFLVVYLRIEPPRALSYVLLYAAVSKFKLGYTYYKLCPYMFIQ